jgi:formate dehydrogenase maturation protein FdhE
VRRARGGPGAFEIRRRRAASIGPASPAAHPLELLSAVLRHQEQRAGAAAVAATARRLAAQEGANRARGRFPLLELSEATDALHPEIEGVVAALDGGPGIVPPPLADAGRALVDLPEGERERLLEAWMDDPGLLDARVAFWVCVAAAPLLELAAASVEPPRREQWTGAACPICGGPPQVSVIAEESGEFMAGSPRYLVCSRCASWWAFPRATCVSCAEDDSRRLLPYVEEGMPCVRVDSCEVCGGYIKTFDLRERAARDVVPLVDDVATLTLDLWAHQQGLRRPALSLAGV